MSKESEATLARILQTMHRNQDKLQGEDWRERAAGMSTMLRQMAQTIDEAAEEGVETAGFTSLVILGVNEAAGRFLVQPGFVNIRCTDVIAAMRVAEVLIMQNMGFIPDPDDLDDDA